MEPKSRDFEYLARCLELAKKAAEQGEVPVGALIANSDTGEILSEAYNLREKLQSPLGHAETLAIHRACRKLGQWRLSGYSLYTSLEPCVMCSGVIVQARLDRVIYSAPDPKGGGQSLFELLRSKPLNHQCELSFGILQEENGEILRNFFRQRR